MREKDGWKLWIYANWIPTQPDFKLECQACRGTGKTFHYEENCHYCMGLGFSYTMHERGSQPEVDKGLVKMLKKAYLEWEATQQLSP